MQAAEVAGFTELEIAQPTEGQNRQYVLGDRAVLIAWLEGQPEQVLDEKHLP
jgi:hypothetical protein